MKNGTFKLLKNIFQTAIFVCLMSFSLHVFAAEVLPANAARLLPTTVNPGVVGNTLKAQERKAKTAPQGAAATTEEEKASKLGPQAAQIKFKLTKITLEGNKTYSTHTLEHLYANKLNKTISVLDLENIVQEITNFYRNNGYILSRAILPPQHVANGMVRIRVIEGFISKVNVQGDPKRARYLLQEYGNKIAQSKPLQLKVMEKYLRLANEIPGMNAKAVLEPSKTDIGASDLNIVAVEKTIDAYISYDNYGTLYMGPNQVTGSISGNSVFQSGDSTNVTMVRTSRPQELKYIDISHQIPMGSNGLRSTLGVNNSQTRPGLNLAPFKISGDAANFYGIVQYPWIRSRDQDLTILGGANYIDSATNTFSTTLYNDHIRSAKIGANYNFADRFSGTNFTSAGLEHGFPLFGASTNPTSPTVSRFGADGVYTKFILNAGHLQPLFWRLSAFIYGTGQYSFNPLLATAQFAYGGSQLGRAYDPGEILGDKGLAGSVELRMDNAPEWRFLQTFQPFVFYDGGVVWNLKNVPGTKQKQSATSTGVGIRFNFMKNLIGQLMLAQPLTKQISAEEVMGDGRKPRGYFSITASV
jgi:hemolysin activation/secretion protein